MKRVRCVAVCLAFVCAAVYLAAEVQSVTPLQIPAGRDAKLLLRGTGLDGVQSCRIQPLAQTVTGQSQGQHPVALPPTDCSVFGKRMGGHTWKHTQKQGDVVVQVGRAAIPTPGLYLMLLSNSATEKVSRDPIMDSVAVVKFRVFDGTMSASDDVAAAVSPNDVAHPYTDCVSQAPASGGLSAIPSRSDNVACGASMLTRGEVIDNFGRHVSDRYNAIQVRVANKNPKYDFLLRDIVLTLPDGRVVSGRIRRFASGVAVKGKTLDRRALAFNALTAVGQVYGALTVFASDGFKTAGNVFQGAGLAGFSQVFPDTTAENVNRFNSAVFDDQNPAIVPKDSIGQPPLYVVALVPKEPGFESYDYAKDIQVAVEGTYIKQVSLVTLDAESRDFGSEFITPSDMKPSDGFAAQRSHSATQHILLSNSNAAPLNLRGVKITNNGAPDSEADFVLDDGETTCGTKGQSLLGNQPFSVAPNQQCVLSVRFQPQRSGALTSTLTLEGDNLEGSRTVQLRGTGVGVMLRLTAPNSPPFACSLSSKTCEWNVPLKAGSSIELEITYRPTNPGEELTMNDGSGSQTIKKDDSPKIVTLVSTPNQASKTLTFTIPGLKDPYVITLNLQTIETSVQLDVTNDTSSAVQLKATVTAAGFTELGGTVAFSAGGTTFPPKTLLKDDTATFDLSQLGVGQTVRAAYSGHGAYQPSDTSGKATVLPDATLTASPTVKGKLVTVNVSAKVSETSVCAGKASLVLSSVPNGAAVTVPVPVSLVGGGAHPSFTASGSGTYFIQFKYETDGKSCASGVSDKVRVDVP